MGVDPTVEQTVLRLTQHLNDTLHLQGNAVRSYSPCNETEWFENGLTQRTGYHLEVAVNREEVVGEVEEGQGAANPPDVDGLSEGQAQGNFRSSVKGKTSSQK